MTARDRPTLKGYFNAGDVPTEPQYADLIDSFPLINEPVGDADTLDGQHADEFAPVGAGVTGGDTHDHALGDGAQIPTLGILNDAVLNTKLANMAQNTIKGRISAGSGDPEDLTQTDVRSIIGAGSGNGLDADQIDGLHSTSIFKDGHVASIGGTADGTNFQTYSFVTGSYTIGPYTTNMPINSLWWAVTIVRRSSDSLMAEAYCISDMSLHYQCQKNSGTWYSWHQVPTTTSLQGTSFPGSPATGRRFFRTDLGYDCYWNGTYWLTVNEYSCYFEHITQSDIFGYASRPLRIDYRPYFTRLIFNGQTASLSDSNYWSVWLRGVNQAYNDADNLVGHNMNSTNGWTSGVDRHYPVNVNRVSTLNPCVRLDVTVTKTGSPGQYLLEAAFYYKLVIG